MILLKRRSWRTPIDQGMCWPVRTATVETCRRWMLGLGLGLIGLLAFSAGCLVDSHCQADYDCASPARCLVNTGQCQVECDVDKECLIDGVDLGRQCINHRCVFLFDERVPAPNFCLDVVNPRSTYHGQELCLSDLKGKVLLIFFGLPA